MVAADKGVRAYCKVIGVIDKEITFKWILPDAAAWNGKFLWAAAAGFWEICRMASSRWPCSGAMPRRPPIPAIRCRPMAAAHGRTMILNGWSIGAIAVRIWRRPTPSWSSRPITRRQSAHSYYYGMSGSGRVALVEAERFPSDFSGIVRGLPGCQLDQT